MICSLQMEKIIKIFFGDFVPPFGLFLIETRNCLLTCVDKLSCCLKLNNSNFNSQICYIMNTNLTVKKILDKLARDQRLTHNEELFYMVEVLYFSEEKAEQLLECR